MTEIIKPGASETRNSKLRQIATPFTATIARGIVEKAPWLPTEFINLAGSLVVTWASLAAKGNNRPLETAALIAIGSGLDAIDGPHAREKDRRSPGSVNFQRGGIIDALGDRYQELSLAISRAISAHNRGDKIGRVAALSAGATSSIPSIIRACAETRGIPVPESGSGLLGLIGTRPGRAVLGTVATVIPEVKGFPIQPALDTLMTVSNLKTASDRLRIALKGTGELLPEKTRQEAKVRLAALGAFGILALGASIFTHYWLRRQKPLTQKGKAESPNEKKYPEIISSIEQYCQWAKLDHRFVGGTITDLIGPETEFNIDIEGRTIRLINPNKPNPIRKDGTVKDIDLVIFSPDREGFLSAQRKLRAWSKTQRNGQPPPNISIEAARHLGTWPERNRIGQLVSAFEFDEKGQPSLVFGAIRQEINPKSLEAWQIQTGEISITTLNPIAHALCYALRGPSGVKEKDKTIIGSIREGDKERHYNKMGMAGRLAHRVMLAGREKGVDYKEIFRRYVDYIHTLNKHPDPLTAAKAKLIRLYWKTIGTSVSHGVGIFHKLSTLSDRFTG